MQSLAQIAPILGSYNEAPAAAQLAPKARAAAPFGNSRKSRYANEMSASELQWNDEVRGNALVLSPKGRVDEATADAFKDHLVESMQSSPERAVIDLSGIDYMSSRGLRGFTLAQRAATQNGTTIVLAAPNDTLREILQISRYDTIFTVTETVEAALGN
ncbi:STAS domain-containing protein [Erythrobacter sp. SCSIO 43205]|uniref:STAS domain-containing protein n=1 Tax=Erythrobacter sp. SCSIO 43205 TaxID=2779361 RepID=UPI002106E69A|nr:STAS domain-containing protein [Erythrobacter sp. SCSIO 43205]